MKQRLYRFLQLVIAASVLFAILYGWHVLHDSDRFPIRDVKIQASYTHLDKQGLETTIVPFVEYGFFNLSAHKLKQQLLLNPWIANATVNRVWPDTVIIKIDEQKPVARWGSQQLVNDKGQVFTPPTTSFAANLPLLNSPATPQASALLQTYQQLQAILLPLGWHIVALDTNDRQALNLTLANGAKIILGRKDPLLRLQRFVKVYPKIMTVHDAVPENIDLRYENGLAIQWQPSNKTMAVAIESNKMNSSSH